MGWQVAALLAEREQRYAVTATAYACNEVVMEKRDYRNYSKAVLLEGLYQVFNHEMPADVAANKDEALSIAESLGLDGEFMVRQQFIKGGKDAANEMGIEFSLLCQLQAARILNQSTRKTREN